jgi:TolB-like protein/class 3 adenylate cyclase
MANKEIERKIAVIFATDVVGYSKSVEVNEEQTIKNFRACKKILEDLFLEHDGRIFNTAGDSVLAEFSSAVSAVICATEFQRLMKERNESETTDLKMEFRIGINMGDVVVEGDNLYGDGVNIAARLEALAQPNGVCLSRSVHEFINKKMDFLFNDLGEQTVKDNKFHAFDVVIDDSHKRTVKTKSKSKIPLVAAIIGILVLGIGGFAYYQNVLVDSAQKSASIADRPTVLVMPFANQSGSAEQDYIGMGMTSHLITMLSQFDRLLVLAKNTGEHILNNKVPNEEIVKQYGVKYVLNGTTQAAGKRVRVNVELTDLTRNSVVWSEVYDFKEEDIFEVQDKVGDSVLGHLGQEVIAGSAKAGQRWKTTEALKNEVLCVAAFHTWTQAGYHEAKKRCDANLKLEPENPFAVSTTGWLLYQKVLMGLSQNAQEDFQKAHKLATQTLEKHPYHVLSIQLASTMEAIFGDFEAACGRLEKMAKLSREIIEIVSTAETQRQCGDYQGSIEMYEKAFEISPHFSSWIKVYYTYALLQNGDIEAAKIYALEQSAKEHSYSRGNAAFFALLAYIHHKEGDEELAQEYFDKQKTMQNRMTKASIEFRDFSTVRSKVFVNDYVKVLQSLGLPDQ